MKHLLTLLLLFPTLCSIASEPGDDAKSEFGKDFLPEWNNSVNIALEVAKAMPEELYDFKPNDSSKTFAEQISHIGFTSLFLAKSFILGEKVAYEDPNPSEMSKSELIEYLEGNLKEATEIISNMTDEDSKETVTVFGGKQVKRYIATLFIQDHLTNHRAKANLYIRMNDIKPPAYGFF